MDRLVNSLVAALSGWSVWSGMVIAGGVLCVAAVLALIAGAARPTWFSATGAGSAGFALARGALDGLPLGLASGLLGGFAFEYIQSLLGVIRFTFAAGLDAGLALGIASGALVGFALGRLTRLPAGLTLGAFVGLIVGFAVFLVEFGVSAGYGPERDSGVGPEIGVLLGTAGALLGALAAVLLRAWVGQRAAGTATDASPQRRRVGRGAAVGAGVGALCGLMMTAASWLSTEAPFILPGVAPGYAMSGGALAGRLYWLAVFVTLGGLIGALAGAISAGSRWHGVSLAVWLALGLLFGLSLGLTHGDVGGPMFATRPVNYDPAASIHGLMGGLLIGALAGVGCALALRWAYRQPGRRELIVAAALLALGVMLLLGPMWFHPLFGVDIY